MAEVVIEVPKLLRKETGRIRKEAMELISLEEKRKMLSLFIGELMKGAKQLDADELVKLGRRVKRGRAWKLRSAGLA